MNFIKLLIFTSILIDFNIDVVIVRAGWSCRRYIGKAAAKCHYTNRHPDLFDQGFDMGPKKPGSCKKHDLLFDPLQPI